MIQLMMIKCILIYHKEINNGMVAMDKFAYIRVADVVALNEELARLRAEVANLKENIRILQNQRSAIL